MPTTSNPAPDSRSFRWSRQDALYLLLLALCCLWSIHHSLVLAMSPCEDAAMLLRYSLHLAQGYGIRWNIHDAPVDGATDFLYMALIAALSRTAHITVIAASRILNVLATVLSVLLVYIVPRRLFSAPRALAFAAAAYLSVGPGIKLAAMCFGAPFFACTALLAWTFALVYMEKRPTLPTALAFSLLALLTGLVRPEGVLFAGFMLLAIISYLGWRASAHAFASFAFVFALLGGSYFLWHWRYFGYPLPNPFYLKGGGHFYFSSLRQSIVNESLMLAPVLPLLILALFAPTSRRRLFALLIPASGFTFMWLLLNNWNNHMMRFQYPLVPIVLMSLPGLLMESREALHLPAWMSLASSKRLALSAAFLLALASSMGYFDRIFTAHFWGNGMERFAGLLSPYAGKGYTMAVTEAGQLPLYSDWRVIDALGLNDSWMAHHGERLSDAYLDSQRPELIQIHVSGPGPGEDPRAANALLFGTSFDPAVVGAYYNHALLAQYARKRGYILAAAFSPTACEFHLYYVRPDFPDSDAIISRIRTHPYYYLDNNMLSRDVRDQLRPFALPCQIG